MINKWKVIAIVFIILFFIETLFFVAIWQTGVKELNNERICKINICANGDYDGFYYDSPSSTCECYKGQDVAHQELLK